MTSHGTIEMKLGVMNDTTHSNGIYPDIAVPKANAEPEGAESKVRERGGSSRRCDPLALAVLLNLPGLCVCCLIRWMMIRTLPSPRMPSPRVPSPR